jgi:hypothetical protein
LTGRIRVTRSVEPFVMILIWRRRHLSDIKVIETIRSEGNIRGEMELNPGRYCKVSRIKD